MSYVSNIANSIIYQSGRNAVLGPEMYTAIAEWEKREIPVTIVLKSITEVCGREEKVRSDDLPVDLFQDAVIRNFRQWLASGSEVAGNA